MCSGWNKFSVQIPMALAREHPHLIRIEPASSFFWPAWDDAGLASLFSSDFKYPEAFSFHLWETKSWSFVKDLNPSVVRTKDTTYNKIARRFLSEIDLGSDQGQHVTDTTAIKQKFSTIYDKRVWGHGSGLSSTPLHH